MEARVEIMIQTEVGEVLVDTVLLLEHLAGEHPQNLHYSSLVKLVIL